VHVTVVSPTSNWEPDGGVQVTGTGTPPLSAVTSKVTTAPAVLVASAAMSSSGGLNTGGVPSTLTWRSGGGGEQVAGSR
jgi:hypothetical protein